MQDRTNRTFYFLAFVSGDGRIGGKLELFSLRLEFYQCLISRVLSLRNDLYSTSDTVWKTASDHCTVELFKSGTQLHPGHRCLDCETPMSTVFLFFKFKMGFLLSILRHFENMSITLDTYCTDVNKAIFLCL